jgi:hypothetical protein
MPYVISKMAANTEYTVYKRVQDGKEVRNIPQRGIVVKGGQGVADRRTLLVPTNGVVTEITDEEAEILKQNTVFKMHEENGYVKIVYSKDTDSAANEMQKEDDSAQLTKEDFRNSIPGAEDATLKVDGEKVETSTKVAASHKRNKG